MYVHNYTEYNIQTYVCMYYKHEIRTYLCTTYMYVSIQYTFATGVPKMVPNVTVDNNTVSINRNNVTITLSWGEPFNNLDPIVNYTVSCSGDVTCPPNFTTTDNTTRITNLNPVTDYTFSVVATNSIGSGEAGVVMIATLGKLYIRYVRTYSYIINDPKCICYICS